MEDSAYIKLRHNGYNINIIRRTNATYLNYGSYTYTTNVVEAEFNIVRTGRNYLPTLSTITTKAKKVRKVINSLEKRKGIEDQEFRFNADK